MPGDSMAAVDIEPRSPQRENRSVHKAMAILRSVASSARDERDRRRAVGQHALRATAGRMIEVLVAEGMLASRGGRDGVRLDPWLARLGRSR